MPTTRSAHIERTGWVAVTCQNCSKEYSCLVEGTGHSNDTFVPASDKDLREAAMYGLRKSMERRAAGVPCPNCGTYNREHVEARMRTFGRAAFWLTFLLFGFVLLLLSIVTRLKPMLFVAPLAAFVAGRVSANIAAQKGDLNRDTAANLRAARMLVSQGLVRLDAGR